MSLLDRKRLSPAQREAVNRMIAENPPVKADPHTWYRCTSAGCTFKTKQRRGLLEVMHRCSVSKTLRTLKEDT